MLEFSVSNQLLTRLDATAVFSGSENYLECAFTFSEDWEGLTPVAVFGHTEVEEPISVPVANGVCRVPHEVIAPYGFCLAVYGSGNRAGGQFTHVPTNTVTVEVGESGAGSGLVPEAPTPSLYDMLLDQLREAEGSAVAAKTSAAASALSAAGSAEAAVDAMGRAEAGAEGAEREARSAAESALAAQRNVNVVREVREQAEEDLEKMTAALEEGEDTLVRCKSYAVGTADFAVTAELTGLSWTEGKAEGPYLGLEPGRRYVVEIDGAPYDGVSRVTAENVPMEAPVSLFQYEERPEEIPGGDPGPQVDPPEETPVLRYLRVVTLKAGPVTLEDCLFPEGDLEHGECHMTSRNSGVRTIRVLTDGRDNGKYFMTVAGQEADRAERGARLAESSAQQAGHQAWRAMSLASHPPKVEQGKWMAWDPEAGAYADTGERLGIAITDVYPSVEAMEDDVEGEHQYGDLAVISGDGADTGKLFAMGDREILARNEVPDGETLAAFFEAMKVYAQDWDDVDMVALDLTTDFLNNALGLRKNAQGDPFESVSEFFVPESWGDLAFNLCNLFIWTVGVSDEGYSNDGYSWQRYPSLEAVQYAIIHMDELYYDRTLTWPGEEAIQAAAREDFPWMFHKEYPPAWHPVGRLGLAPEEEP